MKKYILLAATVLLMSCSGAFDIHPYDVNIKGETGNTRMLAFNANFGLFLSRHLSLDLRGSYFMRRAHYRDFEDVDARTFEVRAGLTYKL